MKKRVGNRLLLAVAGGTACITLSSPSLAQQASGTGSGFSATLGLSSTLRYDDNLGLDSPSLGSTSRWENSLNLSVVKETQIERLTFDLGGILRAIDEPVFGSDFGFKDPRVALSYARDTGNSLLQAGASYREQEIRFNEAYSDINSDGVIDAGDLVIDQGQRQRSNANLTLRTGINDPLGFQLRLSHREVDYSGVINPDLFYNRSDKVDATAFFQVSPVIQGNATLSYTDFSADDVPQTDRQTSVFKVGATFEISPTDTLDASIGRTRIEETVGVGPSVTTTDNGTNVNLAYSRQLANGSIGAFANHDIGVNGERTTISASRSIPLASGNLDFSLGATRGPFGETTPIGSLAYNYNLPTGRISADITRSVGSSTQNNEVRQTRARINYLHTINSISSVSFGVSYAEQIDTGNTSATDRVRANVNASYSHSLTQDWTLTTGVSHRFLDELGSSASGDTLFITLDRLFTLKP